MARFDVYKYTSPKVSLVVDVQADLLRDLNTVVVLPLISETIAKNEAAARLKPTVMIDGQRYILMTTDIGTVKRSTLGDFVANIEDEHRQDITDALDFLFQGF